MTPADPNPRALWVNDTDVYWASGGDNEPVIPSAIRRVNKSSLMVETLVEIGFLVSVIGDESSIYFGDADGHNIYKMPLAGGAPTALASIAGNPQFMTQDADNIYWTGGSSTVCLDWVHAVEKRWNCGKAINRGSRTKRTPLETWVHEQKKRLRRRAGASSRSRSASTRAGPSRR